MAVEWMPWVDASAECTCYLQPIFGLKHQQAARESLPRCNANGILKATSGAAREFEALDVPGQSPGCSRQ